MDFLQGKLLKDYSTFGIGGEARYFVEVTEIPQMMEVVAYCARTSLPYLVIGKGSNCLFDDKGFDGLVILNKICFCHFEGAQVKVGAGYSFALLGVQTARKRLSGLEFASGIPATVGGAIYMNAGASKQETADTLIEVSFVDETGQLKVLAKETLHFSYRHSWFQERKGAIVAARFMLTLCETARADQLQIIDYRKRTQPYGDLSIGCVFRNPPGLSAGALIEQCGLKGKRIGGAEVSTMHANFLINAANATAQDVLQLAEFVKRTIYEQKGIELEMEVRHISC